MRHVLALFLLTVATPALADRGDAAADAEAAGIEDTGAPAGPDIAEYQRLTQELHHLASRDAWGGVERAYQGCVATGADLSFADHLAGAHAASSRGDVAAVRDRLAAAHALEESREVIEWMWGLDTAYGAVVVRAREGAELTAVQLPFDPRKAAAVSWAAGRLTSEGSFRGMLPAGVYQVGEVRFEVTPGERVLEVEAEEAGASLRGLRRVLPFSG